MKTFIKTIAVMVLTLSVAACDNSLTSPDGRIKVTVDGQTLSVAYAEQTVFDTIHLGLVTESADLDSALTLAGVSRSTWVVDDYDMVSGKKSHCTNEANERTYQYTNPAGDELKVIVRAYDDGIAIRYAVAQGTTVVDDKTSYSIKDGVKRWISALKTDYEQFFPLAVDGSPTAERMWPRPEPGAWAYPALLEPQEGIFALIAESDLRAGDSASSLSNAADPQVYGVHLTGPAAFAEGLTPWRVAIIGHLEDIVESTLVTDLASPSKVEDSSWVTPGVSSWIYWAYNHGSKDWPTVRDFIDLAAEMGWPYCLVDWEWPEMTGGGDIDDVMAYAKEKGVGINLWYNSGTSWIGDGAPQPQDRLNSAENREREMAWLESMGVNGIKVDFFLPDNAEMVQYYLDILEDAARHHLTVDFHGCTIPRGWQRTWPNMLSMESVYGAEWYNNGPAMTTRAAAHNATIPFTRNVIGPMDYTPGTFTDSQFPHITTNAHELALTVLFESGLQHMPDRTSAYREMEQPLKDLFASLPAAWDDTKLLAGYPGESVVLARKSGDTWYVAGVNGLEEPVDLSFSLSRLGLQGQSVRLFADGAQDREIAVSDVAHDGSLTVPCRARGGFVAVLK